MVAGPHVNGGGSGQRIASGQHIIQRGCPLYPFIGEAYCFVGKALDPTNAGRDTQRRRAIIEFKCGLARVAADRRIPSQYPVCIHQSLSLVAQ